MNADTEKEIAKLERRLQGYEELLVDQTDDEAYVARGNGFCDSKYSPEFLEEQIARLQQQIADLKGKE